MKYFLILICFSVFFFGCLTQREKAIKKIDRARELCPECFKIDTIYFRDTIRIKEYIKDTTGAFRKNDSVIVINNEKVILKYYYDSTTNNINHYLKIKGDTVFIEKRVPVEKIIYSDFKSEIKDFMSEFWLYFLGVLLLIIAIIIWRLTKRSDK